MAFDQVKMLAKLQKAQKDLKKEIIEVVAGDGQVTVDGEPFTELGGWQHFGSSG